MKSGITLLFIAFVFSTHAKTNQYDSNGKKHGTWKIYWDQNWKEVNDSTQASYCRITKFVHGQNMHLMGSCGGKNWKLMGPSGEIKPVKGKIILLDGEYKWYKPDGKLSSAHKFNKGRYVDCKEYNKLEKLEQHFDYSTPCEGKEDTYMFHQYDKKGNATHYVWRNDKKGWTFYYHSGNGK